MQKLCFKIFLVFQSLLILATFNLPLALAQVESVDFSYVYTIADPDTVNGDIISSTANTGFVRTTFPYDFRIFGIVQQTPLMVYKSIDNIGTPVSRNGTAQVNVTSLNGLIQPGDYITSSEIPGKGQKATASGYVIGIALTGLGASDGTEIDYQPKTTTANQPNPIQKLRTGQITVALKIEYAELTTARTALRLLDSFNAALFTNIQNPDQFVKIFRYITAIIVVLISFAIGFFTFSRSIPKGIEAIGRNPLAQRAIMFSIVSNIFFTIVTAIAGIVAAIIILRF